MLILLKSIMILVGLKNGLKVWPPQLTYIFWILLKDKILTMDNLLKRGFNIVNRCYLCKNDAKSINHMTMHCSHTNRLWERVCGLLNIAWVFPTTIQHFFSGWKAPSNNALILRLWDLFSHSFAGLFGRNLIIRCLGVLNSFAGVFGRNLIIRCLGVLNLIQIGFSVRLRIW